MKKTFLILLLILLFIIFSVIGLIFEKQNEQKRVSKQNKQYEDYLNKEVKGTDIATLINKIIDQNEKNNIQKDEKGYYIDNRY